MRSSSYDSTMEYDSSFSASVSESESMETDSDESDGDYQSPIARRSAAPRYFTFDIVNEPPNNAPSVMPTSCVSPMSASSCVSWYFYVTYEMIWKHGINCMATLLFRYLQLTSHRLVLSPEVHVLYAWISRQIRLWSTVGICAYAVSVQGSCGSLRPIIPPRIVAVPSAENLSPLSFVSTEML